MKVMETIKEFRPHPFQQTYLYKVIVRFYFVVTKFSYKQIFFLIDEIRMLVTFLPFSFP